LNPREYEDVVNEVEGKRKMKYVPFSKAEIRGLWLALRDVKKRDKGQNKIFTELTKEMKERT